jgi:hypothetical protein
LSDKGLGDPVLALDVATTITPTGGRKMSRRNAPRGFISLSFIALLAASAPKAGWAMHPHVEFDELSHTADIIFAGTVTETRCRFGPNGSTIFTDVTFGDVRTLGRKSHLKPDTLNVVTLTFEGGQVGDVGLKVSGVPRLEVGQRVLLFALHDGREYSNPLAGRRACFTWSRTRPPGRNAF